MAHEALNNVETIDNFDINVIYNIREEFIQNKSVENAINVLEKFVAIPVDVAKIDNSKYWPEICDLLSTLLKSVPVDVMLRDYQIVILSIINKSPERFIQIIAADYFKPVVVELNDLFRETALAVLVALTRRVKGSLCAESLAHFLCYFVDVKEVMQELIGQLDVEDDAEQRFRVYEVAISAMSLNKFSNYSSIRTIIDALVSEINENKILTCITAIEMLSEVASLRKHNVTFLSSIGLLDHIYGLFEHSSNNPDGGLIHCACIRFFAYLTQAEPNALIRYPLFVRETFDMTYHFDLVDATRRQLAFDTLSMISINSEAKQYLHSSKNLYNINKAMNHFGVAIAHSPDDLRVRLIAALRMMMGASANADDSAVLFEWFSELGEPFPTVIIDFLQKPFEDVKISALELLETLFRLHYWAFPLFYKVNGFTNQLLDRKSGESSQVRQLKYDIVCQILNTKFSDNVVDAATLEQFKLYRERSIYYTENEDKNVDWGAI